jgi:hypothetical protein
MTEIDRELSATLDAEYREFVRSLHSETIAIIVEFEDWWQGVHGDTAGCFTATVLKGAGEELSANDERAAAVAEERWRDKIHPRLSILINGHPDPDVREAPTCSTNAVSIQSSCFIALACPVRRARRKTRFQSSLFTTGSPICAERPTRAVPRAPSRTGLGWRRDWQQRRIAGRHLGENERTRRTLERVISPVGAFAPRCPTSTPPADATAQVCITHEVLRRYDFSSC